MNSKDEKVDVSVELSENQQTTQMVAAIIRNQKDHSSLIGRQRLIKRLLIICRFSVAFALIGFFLTIIEAELYLTLEVQGSAGSIAFRSVIFATTLLLEATIVWYYVVDCQLILSYYGRRRTEKWYKVLSKRKFLYFVLEIIICAMAPFPWSKTVYWPYINDNFERDWVMVPLEVIFGSLIVLRAYLLARFAVLHSRLYSRTEARSVAAFSRIRIDFPFVLKSWLQLYPLRMIGSFTVMFCLLAAWLYMRCERFRIPVRETNGLIFENAIWVTFITFLTVGYGDIYPRSYCGRAVSMTIGVTGVCCTALLTAVLMQKLQLSDAEKNVLNFVHRNRSSLKRRRAAATLIQTVWRAHKAQQLSKLVSSERTQQMKLRNKKLQDEAVAKFRQVYLKYRFSPDSNETEDPNAAEKVSPEKSISEALAAIQASQDRLFEDMQKLKEKLL